MVVRKAREEWKIRGNVFDAHAEQTLYKLQQSGLFDELVSPIALGKEANIFSATPGRQSGSREHVIVKIYRLQNCNFKRMHDYLHEDPRYMHTKPQRRATVIAWAQREYRNLLIAREAITVPTPLGFREHIIVMRLIGDAVHGSVARQMKDITPENPEELAEQLITRVAALWKAGLVHADLSAFNILMAAEPVLIDFSQSIPTSAPSAKTYLHRDLVNIASYLKKFSYTLDIGAATERITAQ